MTQSSVEALLRDVEAVLVELEAALTIIDGSANSHYVGSNFTDVEQALTYIKNWVNARRQVLSVDKDQVADFIIRFEQNEFYKTRDPILLGKINSRLKKLMDAIKFGI